MKLLDSIKYDIPITSSNISDFNDKPLEVSLDEIIQIVTSVFGFAKTAVNSRHANRVETTCKHICIYYSKVKTTKTTKELTEKYSTDRKMIGYSVKKVIHLMKTNPIVRAQCDAIDKQLSLRKFKLDVKHRRKSHKKST